VTSTQAAPELSYLEHKVAMYRSQVALRRFEQRAYDLFLENYVKGRVTSRLAKRRSLRAWRRPCVRRTGRSPPTEVTHIRSHAGCR